MPRLHGGPRTMEGSRDAEGYRTWKVAHVVEVVKTLPLYEGPASALQCPGLPAFGSSWAFGADLDIWAWCRWDATVRPHAWKPEHGTPRFYEVEQQFSNKPPEGKAGKRCQDQQIEDPLLQPMRLSGSFVNKSFEATYDRFGNPVQYSTFEQIRGDQATFDDNLPVVKIEQNVADLQLPLVTSMRRSVNKYSLWGVPPRCVRLKGFTWEQKFYGLCYRYYTRSFEFEINWQTFDKDVANESQMALSGHWRGNSDVWDLDNIGGVAPDPLNPRHYNRYLDKNSQPGRCLIDAKTGQPLKKFVDGTKVLNTREILSDVDTVPDGQPLLPSRLHVVVTGNQTVALLTVFGTDANGYPQTANVALGDNAKGDYYTQAAFNGLDNFSVGPAFTPGAGFGHPGSVTVYAQDGVPSASNVHVEFYPGTDYMQLAIPPVL